MPLEQWAARWGIPADCMRELQGVLHEPTVTANSAPAAAGSEAAVQQLIRLESSRIGMRLWRNNNGACMDDTGRLIRYGLANDSQRMSARVKSSDLIGITPHMIGPQDVGRLVGIFTSIEVKRPGWVYKGTDREKAQLAWLQVVQSLGGRAHFAASPADLTRPQSFG